MTTDTAVKIISYIREKQEIRPKELIDYLELQPRAIFKQLKKLLENNQIEKTGKPPKVFYRLKGQRILPSAAIRGKQLEIIEKNYLTITPAGEVLEGIEGFIEWCGKQKLDPTKTATEYAKTIAKYERYKKNGLISGMHKFKKTFSKVFLDKVYYLDFYSIERVGKTKLGALLLYAKQSQNKKLMKNIYELIKERIERIIKEKKINAVGFIPPTVKREVQFQKEMERLLNLSLPKVRLSKAPAEIIVPQKTLNKLEDRIENAKRTIFVEEKIPYKRILMIDDAVGSGATLNETARKVKEKGLAQDKIIGLAITGSYKGFEVLQEI